MNLKRFGSAALLFLTFAVFSANAQKTQYWVTTPDETSLLKKQKDISFTSGDYKGTVINVQPDSVYQGIDGFGYCLTGGSATLINQLQPTTKNVLLNELFSRAGNSIGISYLRISIGASDLDPVVFSYDDLAAGETDVNMKKFSIAKDKIDLIPVLKKILAINPKIKILGSPWSPPVWMKDNKDSKGGSLLPEYYDAYALYFVKYIQQMKLNGIAIDAVTVQNEPENPKNNPSLSMDAEQQKTFIRDHLGPAFKKANIKTKIILFDHNCDHPEYPITILNDPKAKKYIDGSAFHLYVGEVEAMSTVHNAHPDKNLYFTEQWTGSKGTFDGDLQWAVKNVVIGTTRNWSRIALEWNLANDPEFNPHTPGGCTECKGALTIDKNDIKRNVSYYIIAHASKFVPTGSVRIGSNVSGNISNVAFKTPDEKTVLVVLNDNKTNTEFAISYKGKKAIANLSAGAVATFVW